VYLVVSFTLPVIALSVSLVFFPAVIFAMLRLIMRHIDIIVPTIPHEIDRLAAGVIFAAVLAPFFLMTWGYVQVDWLVNSTGRSLPDHDGSCVNEFGLRGVSDVNAAIKARPADAYRHADIGCPC